MQELDEISIRKAAAGDRVAFKRLYDHYRDYLWRVVFRTVNGDLLEAEEVLQLLFVKIYQKLGGFRFKAALSTWLYKLAWSVLMDHFRKKKRWYERFLPFEEEEHGEVLSEHGDELEQLLSLLSPEERYLLVAKEIEGFSFDELAAMTGKSSGSLRTALHRMKERLKREVHDEER